MALTWKSEAVDRGLALPLSWLSLRRRRLRGSVFQGGQAGLPLVVPRILVQLVLRETGAVTD